MAIPTPLEGTEIMRIQQRLGAIRRLLLIAIPLALGLMLFFPLTSEAHAVLLRSDPARDTVLNQAPPQVRMWFSEALNPTFSTEKPEGRYRSSTSFLQRPARNGRADLA